MQSHVPLCQRGRGDFDKDLRKKSFVKTEAGIAVLRHKLSQLPEAERSREGFSPKAFGGSMALPS